MDNKKDIENMSPEKLSVEWDKLKKQVEEYEKTRPNVKMCPIDFSGYPEGGECFHCGWKDE